MSTYWGYPILLGERWLGDFILTGVMILSFIYFCNFLIFYRINSVINRLERVKIWIWFNVLIFWFYLSSKRDGLEFHVNVREFGYFSQCMKRLNIFIRLNSTKGFRGLFLLMKWDWEGCIRRYLLWGELEVRWGWVFFTSCDL